MCPFFWVAPVCSTNSPHWEWPVRNKHWCIISVHWTLNWNWMQDRMNSNSLGRRAWQTVEKKGGKFPKLTVLRMSVGIAPVLDCESLRMHLRLQFISYTHTSYVPALATFCHYDEERTLGHKKPATTYPKIPASWERKCPRRDHHAAGRCLPRIFQRGAKQRANKLQVFSWTSSATRE